MENTGNVHFEDDTPQWYIASGEQWVGPLAASDVYQKVLDQEITLAHFVWKPGQAAWQRICDTKTFQSAVPALPAAKPVVKKASPAKRVAPPPAPSEEKTWFLFYNDSQFGPFSNEEISRFISVGKVHKQVYAWKDGMEGWEKLGMVLEFSDAFNDAPKGPKPPAAPRAGGAPAGAKKGPISAVPGDKRQAPRSPMIARLLLANSDSVSVAMCRDVSIGGMQVLTDRIPGAVGARIKMNVSPPKSKGTGGGAVKFAPFVAEGTIVRHLEDGRGFSFRFTKLSDAARRSIETYIQQAG